MRLKRHPPIYARKPGWTSLLCLGVMVLLFIAACQPAPSVAPSPTPAVEGASPASSSANPPGFQPASAAGAAWLAQAGAGLAFENLSLDQGLSQSVVVDILQDELGFLWFATQDGLNRYDGYGFEIFKNDPQDDNSLTDNFILSLDQDASGALWIGTNLGGLNRYDPHTGQFSHYLHDPNDPDSLADNTVTAVDVSHDGSIWVGTGSAGVDHLNPQTGKFTHYRYDPRNSSSLSSDLILSLLEDSSGVLWVGTFTAGLNRLEPGSVEFSHFLTDVEDPSGLGSSSVQSLYQDHQGVIWVGTTTGGLYQFDPARRGFLIYQHDPDDPASLSHDWVLSMHEDRWGQFWIGTNGGGVNRMDRQSGRFIRYQNDPEDPSSLPNDQVWSIFEDNSGMFWFGTFGSGLATYDPFKNKFLHIHSQPGKPQGLSNDLIWSILQDRSGIFWIATNGGGLNRFDPQNEEWRYYLFDPDNPNGISDNVIYYIYQDRAGFLWLGTNNGLNRFDPQTETFRTFNPPLQVFSILEDHQGEFWVGSSQGLYRFDPETGEFDRFFYDPGDPKSLSSNVVLALGEDDQGNLWIGTNTGGLNLFDRQLENFVRFVHDAENPDSLSNDIVLCIKQASDGTLWVCTGGGLNRFDPRAGKFTAYRKEDGLPDDLIYGMLEDKQGDLWLSTNRGLARFDPRTLQSKNYNTTDGLQSNEFNQSAFLKSQDGMLFFGGVNGLTAFYPDQVQDNAFIPPVVLTRFKIFNKLVKFGPDAPLQGPVEASPEINLHYTDDFFEFEYAALHFSSPEEIQYAYRLSGFESEWNFVGNRRFASYTNVPPGEYVFQVKATNSDGLWNEQGVSMMILIPPPFWQTWWFRLLVLAGVIGSLSAFVVMRFRAIEAQRQKLEIQVMQRTSQLSEANLELAQSRDAAEAASRAKSVFLANMSHEFRTPLNAILGFVQVMMRQPRLDLEQKESLEVIHRSGEHLLGLVNDVLEMSKIEAGRNILNPRRFDLYHLLEGLEEMFALRAGDKGIALRLQLFPQVPRYIEADEGKLRQVLMNLLGNAVKFTIQGEVLLQVQAVSQDSAGHEEQARLRFEVEDTGPGIPPEELEQLFEPFVQMTSGQQSQEGTGLGLAISQQFVRLMGGEIRVESQVGKGSTFSFEVQANLASASDVRTPHLTRRVIGLEPGQPVYRLLVVDDQAVNRKLLVRFFVPLGFEVREAENGKQALEIWETWEPHLIWMDMRMPVMDGYEATRRIKATTRGQATVIVALTASSLEEDRLVILSEGCDDYMRKPFLEADLYEMVAKHLGVRYHYASQLSVEVPESLEEHAQEAQVASSVASVGQDFVERLAGLDPEWLNDLERVTVLGDLNEITRMAGEIDGQDHSLAEGLLGLANRFDHDRIQNMIWQARKLSEYGREKQN